MADLLTWNVEICWWFVRINVLRDTALGTRFAEATRREVSFTVLGNAISDTDAGTSFVLSIARRLLILFLGLLRGRRCRRGSGCGPLGHWWPFL